MQFHNYIAVLVSSILKASNVIALILLVRTTSVQGTHDNAVMCTDPLTGLKYPAGPMPSPEPCQRCVCSEEGKVRCSKVVCLPPPCSNPVNISGQCCPVCPTSVCQHPVTASPLPVGPVSPAIDPTCDKECQCGADGDVECSRKASCPRLYCPDPVRIPGKCCPVCPSKGCLDRKTLIRYNVGAAIPTGDPCRTCFCIPFLGIDCRTKTCPDLPCDNPQKVPGKCCPVCPDTPCKDRSGNYLPVGRLPVRNDCEESCECLLTGEIKCVDKQCPRPNCRLSIQLPGQCCPICKGCMDPKSGKTYPLGPINNGDLCQQCYCMPSLEIACRRLECPPVDCDNPVDVPGECCKRCPDHVCRDLKTREWLKVGPVPAPYICDESCMCNADGKITCDRKQCPETTCNEPFRFSHQCCPVCPDRCPSFESPGVWLPIGPVASSDPCQQNCRCGNDGLVRCDGVTCAVTPCRVPLVSIPGRCCPICPPGRARGNVVHWLLAQVQRWRNHAMVRQ